MMSYRQMENMLFAIIKAEDGGDWYSICENYAMRQAPLGEITFSTERLIWNLEHIVGELALCKGLVGFDENEVWRFGPACG